MYTSILGVHAILSATAIKRTKEVHIVGLRPNLKLCRILITKNDIQWNTYYLHFKQYRLGKIGLVRCTELLSYQKSYFLYFSVSFSEYHFCWCWRKLLLLKHAEYDSQSRQDHIPCAFAFSNRPLTFIVEISVFLMPGYSQEHRKCL